MHTTLHILATIPLNATLMKVLIVLLCTIAVACVVYALMLIYKNKSIRNYNKLQEAIFYSKKALMSGGGLIIESPQQLLQIIDDASEKCNEAIDRLRSAMYTEGVHSEELLLKQKSIFWDNPKDNDGYEWWKIVFHVVKDNTDGTFSVYGYMFSIDNTKRREERLKLSESLALEAKQREDFLMNVSHEIRTPLNAIMGFSDIIAMTDYDSLSPEEHENMSDAIMNNNAMLTKIISDILIFSKTETNRMEYVFRDIDAAEFMYSFYEDVKKEVGKDHNVELRLGRDKIMIHVDPYRLRDIMQQYVSNAVKFSPEGSCIRLGWQYHLNSRKMEFYVEDDGIGIPVYKHSEVFGLFWKNDEFVPGIGIGLSLVRTLAEAMGGEVDLDSRAGVGSRFSVFFKKVDKATKTMPIKKSYFHPEAFRREV